jgi:hypothetical protein
MPIARQTLDATARAYASTMTSIRGRRVHRLLMREFARFDHVLAVVAEDGTCALLALAEDGRAAVCRTDGRGAAAAVAECARLEGLTVTTACDLTKDSLPVVSWTIWHPGLARIAGALTIPAASLSPAEHRSIADVLRRLGR